MTLDNIIAETVRLVVRQEVEPLRQEIAALRAGQAERLLTIVEAARQLGVSPRTVTRQIAAGKIESVTVGRSRRVRLPAH